MYIQCDWCAKTQRYGPEDHILDRITYESKWIKLRFNPGQLSMKDGDPGTDIQQEFCSTKCTRDYLKREHSGYSVFSRENSD
jgi:hypothetical protein